MKKIKAFFIALASFAVVVLILHFTLARSLSNNKGFGTWVNLYKDLSYSAISDNIGEDPLNSNTEEIANTIRLNSLERWV